MSSAPAYAKINLALVVGPTRADGLHEVATILQRIDLSDTISLEPADELAVEGFAADTLVTGALRALAVAARTEPRWLARIEKRIPVSAGLGGGSSDAATALLLANDLLEEPLERVDLHRIARDLGADVPFFLEPGPQLGTGDGSSLQALDLPQDYAVLLVIPAGVEKQSTRAVYERFAGADGFDARREPVLEVAVSARHPLDLAGLPPNDLESSPISDALVEAGAFRADVSGAGPAVYGLFLDRARAERAAARIAGVGRTWVAIPAW